MLVAEQKLSTLPLRLLLVEENIRGAGYLRVLLRDVGPEKFAFTLVQVKSALQAVQLLKKSTFDLVLIELSLRNSSELETVAHVQEAAPTIPIVVMSGLNDEQVAVAAMRSGAQDYLVEDEIDGNMLVRAIRHAIERKKIETQLQQLRNREAVLREINLALTSTLELGGVLDILLERIAELLPGLAVTIRLRNKKTGGFDATACRNVDANDWKRAPSILGGTGLTQAVVLAKTPMVIHDVQDDPRTEYREFTVRHGLVTFLGVPLIVKGDVLGVLGVWAKTNREFPSEEVEFLNTLGSQAAVAIYNSRLYEDVKKANERQTALREFNLTINTSLDLGVVLHTLLDKIVTLGPGYACSIRLVDQETGSLEPVAVRNIDEGDWKKNVATVTEGLTQAVVAAQGPLRVVDLTRDPRVRRRDFIRWNGLVSLLGIPLRVQDEFVGVLNIYTKELHEFSSEEVEFISTLAVQAATAIHNSRLYEKLKTAHAALEKAVEVKSVLMGVMAHELKSPIQVILGAASLLSEGIFGELTDDQRARVMNIESGGKELVELIDNTLQMTRLEQGAMTVVANEICVSTLLAELKSEFAEAFSKKGLDLVINSPLSGFVMTTDRLKLKEILRNLLDNARKFTSQGRVTVDFKSDNNDRVEFIVSDTGIGIPVEYLPKIFNLFYQVDPLQKEHASAGMGLNIVKGLVERMHGEISVTSKVGQGSTFCVTLPKAISSLRPE